MFNEILINLRKSRNISRKELAQVLFVSHWAIAKYESGERTPDYPTLILLADYFDVSLDELLGRNYYMQKSNLSMRENAVLELYKNVKEFKITPNEFAKAVEILMLEDDE